tara:strand:- start:48 stop:359 length:312 start_codon:yes stop_codon:yes gene_type:complete
MSAGLFQPSEKARKLLVGETKNFFSCNNFFKFNNKWLSIYLTRKERGQLNLIHLEKKYIFLLCKDMSENLFCSNKKGSKVKLKQENKKFVLLERKALPPITGE